MGRHSRKTVVIITAVYDQYQRCGRRGWWI